MNNKHFYLYIFKDNNNDIIYIGQTTRNITHRIKEHIIDKVWIYSVKDIYITELNNHADLDLAEIYFINRFHPVYNDLNNYKINDCDNLISIHNFDELRFHKLSIVECLSMSMKNKNYKKIQKENIIELNYFNIYNPVISEEYKNTTFKYNGMNIKIVFTQKYMDILEYLNIIYKIKVYNEIKDYSEIDTDTAIAIDDIHSDTTKLVTNDLNDIDKNLIENISKEKLTFCINNKIYKFVTSIKYYNYKENNEISILLNKSLLKYCEQNNMIII